MGPGNPKLNTFGACKTFYFPIGIIVINVWFEMHLTLLKLL